MILKIFQKLNYEFLRYSDKYLPKYFSKSPFLSSLFYLFFSKAFRREHQAVLKGKVIHLQEEENFFLLIRNTHRIEKGLLMKPRRKIFAQQYISETIKMFITIVQNPDYTNNNQTKWAKDVLLEYFRVVEINSEILQLKNNFLTAIENDALVSSSTSYIPYYRQLNGSPKVSYEDFYALTRQRRSVRWFINKTVPRELIDKAIMAANQSPSACNRQPFEYKIFDRTDLVKEGIHIPMGTAGYSHNVPIFIVVVGNLNAYYSEKDRHLIYIDASLANMSLMLALETLDLSSCAINWPDIESLEKKMDKFLKLKKYQRPIMCLGVGYPDPDGMVAYSEKRSIDQIRTFNLK